MCACARTHVGACESAGGGGGLSNFTQAEVVLIANYTCNLRRRTAASASRKRKRPAAAEVVEADADADNEMDEKKEEDENDAPWLQIQASDLPGLDMVAVWNQKRTQAACDFYLAGITGSYGDGKPVAVWFNAGKTSSRPWVIEFTNPPGPMRMTGKRRFALSPLASGSDSPQPSTTHATSC